MSNLKEILFDALQRPAGERDAFLNEACGTDSALRAEVQSLIEAHESADATGGAGALAATAADGDLAGRLLAPERPGAVIDRYKLLQRIGEGGFGVVYKAEQREPVKRKVALKILKLGMDTKQIIARFDAERQALALMDHPGIARVFDAGATESGRPYFVMELVHGVPITEYCDTHNLTIRERLELFTHVCRAVQHAHQKGIIHRDLKPTNVLVTQHDGRPAPKIIDFGIAKATSAELTQMTLVTEFRQFMGTPQYMSPEQAEMSGLDIDTRSDVYSLGVILYELLTGVTPFDPETLRTASINELQQIIREKEPHKPSTRLSEANRPSASDSHGASIGDRRGGSISLVERIARRRSTDPAGLSRQLRGDVDWIIMRALEKDRTRRYGTANAFAEDIERHVRDEPVLAGPPGVGYRFGKMYRRHRGRFIAAGLVLIVLLAGLVGTTWGMMQALETARELRVTQTDLVAALEDAEEQRDIAEAVSTFLNEDLLAAVAPAHGGRDVKVRNVLDAAAEQIEWRFDDQPAVQATLHHTIGRSYLELGLYSEAERHLKSAAALRKAIDDDVRLSLLAEANLASLYLHWNRYDDAQRLLTELLEEARTALGPEDLVTLGVMNNLAVLHIERADYGEAERLLNEMLEIEERALGSDHPQTIMAVGTLANLAMATGRHDEALQFFSEALERQKESLGEDHPQTFITRTNMANALMQLGRVPEAIELYESTLSERRRVLGADHPDTLVTMINLARAYRSEGKNEETERLTNEVRETSRRVLGEQHVVYRTATSLLGSLYVSQGRIDEAATLFDESLRQAEQSVGRLHIDVINERSRLLDVYRRLGLQEKADALAREHVQVLLEAAEADETDADLLNTAAWELATIEPAELRDPELAVKYATRACDVTNHRNAYFLDTLAIATAAAGDPARAAEIQREALALVPEEDPNRQEMLDHLQQFEQQATNEP